MLSSFLIYVDIPDYHIIFGQEIRRFGLTKKKKKTCPYKFKILFATDDLHNRIVSFIYVQHHTGPYELLRLYYERRFKNT